MKLQIAKASTNVTVYLFIQDSSSTTGAGLTGLVFNSAGLTAYYVRPLAASAALTLATQTVTGAHSDGGFVEVDSTNMPGVYRLDLSDAVCATGVDSVALLLKGATNMAPITLEIQLTDVDLNDGVRAGLTALPNAAADGAGGLPVSDAGGLDMDAILVDTNALNDTKIPDTISLANINAEVDTALSDIGLDHLVSASVTGTDVTNNSIFARLVSASATADWDDFVNTTDSLQALRDRGDSAWITATGFSTHSAADVWTSGTRTLTSGANIVLAKGVGITGFNDLSAAQVNTEVADVLTVDTQSLPGQGTPTATPTISEAITYLYKGWRNKTEQTASQYSLYDDAGTTVDQKATVSDDGTTFTREEVGSGP